MKWIKRDPWSDAFRDVLDRHLGPACEKADIEIDELADIVGAEWVATLWGCAFEDFLTRDLEEAGNIVEDYLKRRGWNEKAPNKAYLRGLRASVMSLHEVSDVKPGKSFVARDLFLGGDPVQITERTATQSLKQWDRIAARVVKTRRGNVIGGGLLPLDRDLSEILLESLERVQKHSIEEGNEVLRDIAPEISGDDVKRAFDRTEVLRMAAPPDNDVLAHRPTRQDIEPAASRTPQRGRRGDGVPVTALQTAARRVGEAGARSPQ